MIRPPVGSWFLSASLIACAAQAGAAEYEPAPEAMDFQQSWGHNASRETSAQPSHATERYREEVRPSPSARKCRLDPSLESGPPPNDSRERPTEIRKPDGRRPAAPRKAVSAPRSPSETETLRDAPNTAAFGARAMARKSLVQVGRPTTEILVGIRVESGQAPRQALETPMSRLALRAGFDWKRIVGYQKIPGSRQMAVLVQGEVAVRNIGKILADPAVVRVASWPQPWLAVNTPALSRLDRFIEFAVNKHPVIFSLLLLGTAFTLGLSFLKAFHILNK